MPQLTAKEMAPAIGTAVQIRMEQLLINATVRDVKTAYGAVRLLVAPVAGTGEQWVDLSRVRLTSPPREPNPAGALAA